MNAQLSIRVERQPDFFALNRLEGDDWTVLVAESDGDGVVGCIAAAARTVWIDGHLTPSTYASDLKVLPPYRGTGVADRLCEGATRWCAAIGDRVPALGTVLGGNRSMARRTAASRGLPPLTHLGTVRVFTLPLLFPGRLATSRIDRVSRARSSDLEEMANVWQRVAKTRHFAPSFDGPGLGAWIARAPGLGTSDYWLARDSRGTIEGFLATWDQHPMKQLYVTGLTPRGHVFRHTVNALAPLLGAARLAGPGERLTCRAAVHLCAPRGRVDVLRRLLRVAYADLHGRYAFLTIGLDARDELVRALRGFAALPADVDVFTTSPDGTYVGPSDSSRPLHFETALV